MSVISCYAPTFRSPHADKEEFFAQFQSALSDVNSADDVIVLGDFNARVGFGPQQLEMWQGVHGSHGVGDVNDAGHRLLTFLACQQLTVCNTLFPKKRIHMYTWQHPGSQKWHCIDYVFVRQQHRKRCMDCQVMRTAECSTDHRLVRMKYRLPDVVQQRYHHDARSRPRKFAVHQFNRKPFMSEEEAERVATVRAEYCASLESRLATYDRASSVDCKWSTVKSAVVDAAEQVVGRDKRRMPDWFRDNALVLEPLLESRNTLYSQWLRSGRDSDHRAFKEARGRARTGIRKAKTTWLMDKAAVVHRGRFSGKAVWSAIRDMQRCFGGLQPLSVQSIRNADGVLCESVQEQQGTWHGHFSGVLNVCSVYDPHVFQLIPQREVEDSLSLPPSEDELTQAIRHLQNGKAGGMSQIVPELLKVGVPVLHPLLLDLLQSVWSGGCVPQDWRDALLVPIPKKGDLSRCDNWRGIALLEVVGKLAARIMQNRLQGIAEAELPESQCGFRRHRGCADAIFSVRQLVEKSYEHRSKLFCVFVDLRKAYDSVPREALWQALLRLGVPPPTVAIIKSFHTDMSACVRVAGGCTDPISVKNGLRQGCVMAPVLFNLYFGLVIERWRSLLVERGIESGVDFSFTIDGQLFPRVTRRRPHSESGHADDFEFADDAVLLATTRNAADQSLCAFCEVASSLGLTVSMTKTKLLVAGFGVCPADCSDLVIGSDRVEAVTSFPYLGSTITPDSRSQADIRSRLAKGAGAFGGLRRILHDRSLNLPTRRHLYVVCVLSTVLYGSECWTPLKADLDRMDRFHHANIRSILGVSRGRQWEQRISSQELRAQWGDPTPLSRMVQQRRLEWLGHLARLDDTRVPKQLLFACLPQSRPFCGPRRRWKDTIHTDLSVAGVRNWFELASDRGEWRGVVTAAGEDKEPAPKSIECPTCNRLFRRSSDMVRHKCSTIRQLPVSEQPGSVQCPTCNRWLRSRGGFAVHKCRLGDVDQPPAPAPAPLVVPGVTCTNCQRSFKSAAGLKRHRCGTCPKRPTVAERQQFKFHCQVCHNRRFRRRQDLERHLEHCLPPP